MEKKETKKVEPIVLDCGKPIDGACFKGNTFEIQKTNRGIVYRLFGGYAIFVEQQNKALYETLDDLIENQATYAALTGKEREDFELNLSCIAYVLNVPLFSFSNAQLCFNIATQVIEFLHKSYEEAMQQPLKEETIEDIEQNREFEDAVKGLENIQEALKEETKD